jgi:hypothetical protein
MAEKLTKIRGEPEDPEISELFDKRPIDRQPEKVITKGFAGGVVKIVLVIALILGCVAYWSWGPDLMPDTVSSNVRTQQDFGIWGKIPGAGLVADVITNWNGETSKTEKSKTGKIDDTIVIVVAVVVAFFIIKPRVRK